MPRNHHAAAAATGGRHVHDACRRIHRRGIGDVQAAIAANVVLDAGVVIHLEPGEKRTSDPVFTYDLQRLRPQLRCEVDHVVLGKPEGLERFGPGGDGLGRCGPVPGNHRLGDRLLFNRPDRLAGLPIEGVDDPCLRRLDHRRNGPPVHLEIHDHRDVRKVVVPLVVVDRLEVPDPLAGLDVQRDHAGSEEVVPRTEASEVVDRGRIRRDVDDPSLTVRGHWSP